MPDSPEKRAREIRKRLKRENKEERKRLRKAGLLGKTEPAPEAVPAAAPETEVLETRQPMAKGKIKKLVSDRGFGFITGDDGKDIYFHSTGLKDVEFATLQVGQVVEYEVGQGEKGPRAQNVRLSS